MSQADRKLNPLRLNLSNEVNILWIGCEIDLKSNFF